MEVRKDLDGLVKLSFFADIGKAIIAESSIRGVLDRVMEHIGLYFAPCNWSLLLHDAESDQLVFKLAVGQSADKLKGMRIPSREGIAGWVMQHRAPLIVEDVDSDPRFSGHVDEVSGFNTESIIAVPLVTGNTAFGVIELINRLDHSRFTAFDLNVLSTIADFAAIAIEKAYYLQAARRLAMTDPLTGALNRRGLERAVERETERCRRYGGEIAVIMGDVDDFKAINDSRGHLAGDEVLKAISKALRRTVREIDTVARIGGDEFLVLMPNTSKAEAENARTRISEALEEASHRCRGGSFSFAMGLHVASDLDFSDILRESDKDLYRHKEAMPSSIGIERHILEALDDESFPQD
jgi:diguanylate cyclase (GGDEF)-like protein